MKIYSDYLLKKETAFISSFFSFYLLFILFKNFDFSLIPFSGSELYISQATLDNINIGNRITFFYKLIFNTFFVLPIFYLFFSKLFLSFIVQKRTILDLTVLSFTGFLLILSNIYGINNEKSIHLIFIITLINLIFILLSRFINLIKLLANNTLFSITTVCSFIILSVILFLFNSNIWVNENSIWIYTIIFIFFNSIIVIFKKVSNLFTRKFFPFLLPISFTPVFIFLSTEFCFFIETKYNFFFSYKWIFIFLMASSFIVLLIYQLRTKKITPYIFIKFITSSSLLTFLILTVYHPIIEQPRELFELANPSNAQMRLFSFHQIPFLDFMSSHMFAEQFYGIIYNLIYGFDGSMGFLSYRFFYEILFYLIAYFFLTHLFKNRFLSILLLLSFPLVKDFFSINLFFSIILFFVIQKLIQLQNIKNYLLVFFLLVISCFWRLDVGVSTVFSSIIYLPIILYTEQKKINFSHLYKSLGITSLLAGLSVLIVLIFRDFDYLINHIKTALHYISANQAHGYSLITNNFNQQFYNIHFTLPLVSVLAIIYIFYRLKTHSISLMYFEKFTLQSSLFLFLIFLFNFQRGLVRHTFMENTDAFLISTFYIALTLFIVSFLKKSLQLHLKYILFVSISFCLIVFVKFFPISQGNSPLENFLNNSSFAHLKQDFDSSNRKGKLIKNPTFEDETYTSLKYFLDINLNDNQTFLDFSNTPMLYYYCKRNVPSYFCQNLQNTVDLYLQAQQIKQVNPINTPVVIYSNYPPNWWDNTDNVPNTMRQSSIAEYIYQNYKPYTIINNRSIWVANSENFKWNINQIDTIIPIPKVYNYKYAALTINDYAKSDTENYFRKIEDGKPLPAIKEGYSCFETSSNVSQSKDVYLSLKFNKTINNQEIVVETYNQKNGLIGTIKFTQLDDELDYMIPISNHYLWYNNQSKYIQISTPENINLAEIEFYKNIRNEY